jgi:predicted transcriptional regulator
VQLNRLEKNIEKLMNTNENIIKSQIAHLGFPDFCKFVLDLFKLDYQDDIEIYSKIGYDVLLRKDNSFDFCGTTFLIPDYYRFAVYFLEQIPLGLFKNPHKIIIDNPHVRTKMQSINEICKDMSVLGTDVGIKHFSRTLGALCHVTNIYGYDMDFYQEFLYPQYQTIVDEIGFNLAHDTFCVGNPDTFYMFSPKETLQTLLNSFIQKNAISIELSNNAKDIRLIKTENPYQSGVGKINKSIFAPIYSDFFDKKNAKIEEFEYLLKSNPNEAKLEKFIKNNYQDIFGGKYDRIETQIWLKFPEFDISGKNRRLDIFMHNATKRDWELFELKKNINLTRTYRDSPVLASEIYYSMQQVKNYDRLLKNPSVKEYFIREGIEYYEPTLHLVVGNVPSINIEQWRALVASNKDVNLLTYSELFNEMQIRYKEKEDFLNNYFINNV